MISTKPFLYLVLLNRACFFGMVILVDSLSPLLAIMVFLGREQAFVPPLRHIFRDAEATGNKHMRHYTRMYIIFFNNGKCERFIYLPAKRKCVRIQ